MYFLLVSQWVKDKKMHEKLWFFEQCTTLHIITSMQVKWGIRGNSCYWLKINTFHFVAVWYRKLAHRRFECDFHKQILKNSTNKEKHPQSIPGQIRPSLAPPSPPSASAQKNFCNILHDLAKSLKHMVKSFSFYIIYGYNG